jgi:hypothetical protein
VLTILANGNVGIGTLTPTRAKLDINGGGASAFLSNIGGYMNRNGANDLSNTDETRNFSIVADNTIGASEIFAWSDARIKNIRGRSDGATDLATLNRIEITDYAFKDVIAKGAGPQKKVIAQQVETVYPQAVSKSTDVVPDIYQKATVKDGWVTLGTDLKVGERVRLIGDKSEGIHEVLEVRDGAFRTAFQPASEAIFVYGREVKDFRSVDYEAIAMLNVSATQELSRRLEKQAAGIAARDAKIATLEKANQAMRQELAAQKELVSHIQTEFTALRKEIARRADKSAGTFAFNDAPTEAK